MKKIIRLFTVALALSLLIISLASCGEYEPETVEVSSSDELLEATKYVERKKDAGSVKKYLPSENDIKITSDFTIRTQDAFFAHSLERDYSIKNIGLDYRDLPIVENMVFDGQGLTITIKGETNGKLGTYTTGIFSKAVNCEFKNINIIYDLDLKVSNSDVNFGGLVGTASGCTFTNCTVTYKRITQGYTSRFGGMVGWLGNGSTMTGCSVKGNLTASGETDFGGLVGVCGVATVIDSSFEGKITSQNLCDSTVGGLVGWLEGGEVKTSTVKIEQLSFMAKTTTWSNGFAYCGGLAGVIRGSGNLHDCVVKFKDGGYIEAADKTSSSIFKVDVLTGVVAGFASQGTKVKNILVDAKGDEAVNIKFPENSRSINLGIHTNESTSVEKIYYAETPYVQEYNESIYNAVNQYIEPKDYIGTFTLGGKSCSIRVCIIQTNEEEMESGEDIIEEYALSHMIVKIGDEEFTLTKQRDDSRESAPHFYGEVNGYRYDIATTTGHGIIDIKVDLAGTGHGEATFVSDYSLIDFGGETGVIGGAENAWTTDSNGKPILR
jgi:hypothetical protein